MSGKSVRVPSSPRIFICHPSPSSLSSVVCRLPYACSRNLEDPHTPPVLCVKNLTWLLVQDYDEKRCDWRKQKQSVINAIGMMTARALRFEDKERKTIALYALEYYKVRLAMMPTEILVIDIGIQSSVVL